jgi:hypothetical protein
MRSRYNLIARDVPHVSFQEAAVRMANKPDSDTLAKATEMYLSGASIAASARQFRVPVHQLTQHLEQLGVKRQLTPRDHARHLSGRHPRRTDVTADDVADLYEWGWSVVQLAEKFHCNRSVIEHRLRQAGVQRHSRSEAGAWGHDLAKARQTHE